MSIGTTVIELRESKEKEKKKNDMDKMGLFLANNGILGLHSLVLTCVVHFKSHEIESI